MRIQDNQKLVISDDTLNVPKFIRFSEEFEDIDFTLLKELVQRQETLPIGTTVIPLGNIALGKFLYIKPKQDLQVAINGGAPITLRGLKATRMWVEVTSLSLITTVAQEVVLVCAGE